MISEITSFTAGSTQSHGCELPSSGGIVIDSDVTATLAYGASVGEAGCVNSVGANTAVTLARFQSSGSDINTQPDLNGGVQLVTGSRNDFLPDSSTLCLKSNGRLLFAGHEYTGNPNTTVVSTADVVVPNSGVTWTVANNNYTAGISSSGSSSITGSTVDDFGVVSVSTTGFESLNGAYSGSALSISHSLQGAGTYSLGTTSDLIENIASKQMRMNVTVGTLNTSPLAATLYQALSGSVEIIVDNNGKYHLTVNTPITLTKTIDVGTGVPNAPETISFTMNNIHDFQN